MVIFKQFFKITAQVLFVIIFIFFSTLEAKNLELRKTKISEILTTYSFDNYNNTTIQ